MKKRGYWNPFWDEMLALDPEFFDAYTVFSSVPWVSGTLSPKMKEFIYTAFDVAATHLYVSGLRQHIRNALGYGATREELMEVFQIASTLGIHACSVGVPILLDELRAKEKAPASAAPAPVPKRARKERVTAGNWQRSTTVTNCSPSLTGPASSFASPLPGSVSRPPAFTSGVPRRCGTAPTLQCGPRSGCLLSRVGGARFERWRNDPSRTKAWRGGCVSGTANFVAKCGTCCHLSTYRRVSHEHDHPEAEVSPDDDRAHVPDHDNPQHGGR